MRSVRAPAVLATIAIVLAGCGATPAPSPSAPTAAVAPDIDSTIAWMRERTMRCEQQAGDAWSLRWDCFGTAPWNDDIANQLTVTIEVDAQDSTRLIATLDGTQTLNHELCPGQVCDPYIGFFADTVALSPLTGAAGPAIGRWIEEHARAGGHQQFGRLAVEYRPTLPIMVLRITIASGTSPA